MFAAVKDTLYRHRRKFVVAAAVTCSALLVNKYTRNRLLLWHYAETDNMLMKQKKRQHYDKLIQTSNATVLSLSQSITKIVLDDLDTDSVLQDIRANPRDKQAAWERLKVLGFSRCMASIYSAAVTVSVVYTQLMVLGGYSFQNISSSPLEGKVDEAIQEEYLSFIRKFVENGVPAVVHKIYMHTQKVVEDIPLDTQLTVEGLETILKNITIALQGQDIPGVDAPSTLFSFQNFFVDPMKSYPKSSILSTMLEETEDILATSDFGRVVEILVQHGVNHALDHLVEYYPTATGAEETDPPVLPLAKLIPVLNGMAGPALSPAPGQLLQKLMMNDYVEAFCFNIYESFSSTTQLSQ